VDVPYLLFVMAVSVADIYIMFHVLFNMVEFFGDAKEERDVIIWHPTVSTVWDTGESRGRPTIISHSTAYVPLKNPDVWKVR
jgi:hypothetical protein